jgi:hypothetical protein
MATYSTNLALTLLATGEGAGTWGDTTNTNLGTLLEQSISGYVTESLTAGTTLTLTIPNGATGVARNMYLEFTGNGSTVIVPSNKKLYFVYNNCASGTISFKVAGQTGVSLAIGEKKILVSNGTDIVEATTYLSAVGSSLNLTTLTATSANITTLTGTSATITNILDGVGNVRNIPASSSKNTAYTLATTDIGTFILTTSGTITVPNNTFAAGNAVSVFNNSASAISLTISTTTGYIGGTNTNRTGMTLATRGVCTVLFVNPSFCVVTGNVS